MGNEAVLGRAQVTMISDDKKYEQLCGAGVKVSRTRKYENVW